MTRPNIVYLHCHDAGRYVQPFGRAVATPSLQKLAGEGTLFRHAVCASPSCSASRAALLTGQYPHSNGMMGLAHRGYRLNDYRHHIIHTLHELGYTSALAGMQHIAKPPAATIDDIGYEQILTERSDFESPTDAAIRFLHQSHDRPFFLDVGYHAPHRAGESFDTLMPLPNPDHVAPPDPLPDTPAMRRDMAQFIASMQSVDLSMGRVLQALEASGHAENTVVIATTDHGIAFPGMKATLTDHGIGVMLIVRGPAGSAFNTGRACDAMVSHVDIFPTICELLDAPAPSRLQGRSMLPLVRDGAEQIHDAVFAELTYHAAYEPMRAVRTQRHKYIRRFDDREHVTLPNCDNSLSKHAWADAGWADRTVANEMLFDLTFDPNEACNLAGDAAHGAVLEELRGRLGAWMRDTQDPLLSGTVPLPTQTTDPAAYSPDGSDRPPPQFTPYDRYRE